VEEFRAAVARPFLDHTRVGGSHTPGMLTLTYRFGR